MPDAPEGYYYSSLEAEEIEDRLLHVVTYHKTMHLSDDEKALFRTNIGAGTTNTGLIILGYFDTLEDLRESLTVLPKAGDAYGIGTSAPYDIYIYDGYHGVWINNGPLNPGGTTFDDNTVSSSKGWTSNKIRSELNTLDGNKQARITASGILKGDGSGGVSAARAGADYLTPATAYSPIKTISASPYAIVASDIGKTLRVGFALHGTEVVFTLNQAVSATLPVGTEIALINDFKSTMLISTSGVRVNYPGSEYSTYNGYSDNGAHSFRVSERFSMCALKKMEAPSANGDLWGITGNVEVVS